MKFFKEIQQPVTEATRPDAYQRDEINATSGFGKNSYAYQMDGGANDEDHEGDRRREQQVQSGTWYVRINGKIVKDKAGQPYTFRGKAAANKAALTMQAKPFNQGKEIMLTTNPNDKVAEGTESGAYYGEQVAQQIFDKRQDITSEEEVLNQAYHIVANELGQKTARYKFNYDEDFPSDVVSNYFHLQKQGVTEGVAETLPLNDALKLLRQYGAEHFKTTSNELHFYKNGQPFSVDLVMNPDATRSVTLSSLNSARRGLTGQGVTEGYYDLDQSNTPGMEPIDLSTNPSFKELVTRYTQLVYQGHTSETSPEEDEEYDAIEQYVAKRFGEKGSAHLQKAGEVSYWGRDDKPFGRDSRSSNLGRPNQPGGNFRTTKAGKMHGQDAKVMKAKVADRLGRHPEPNLPESTLRESDSPVAGAITRRILQQRHDLLSTYGPVKVMAAIDDVADFVGDTEEIGSSDVSSWVKQVEQTLAGMGEGIEEASLAQMRDYFNQPDDSMKVNRAPGAVGKPAVGIPHEIQALVNKMYHSGKVTPEEFKILQDFQRKTKINVGIKEADTSTGNTGYDSMLAVMKAVDAGNDATFDLGGEPVTLDYNEARFLAGRYKAFLKAGRQEEFLKYMENPVAFDRLMKQLRDLIDKQKNFKGSVAGERGIEEGSQQVDSLVTDALKIMRGSELSDAVAALKTVLGDREYNGRRGYYNFYVKQLVDMYGQRGVAEGIADTIKAGAKKAFDKLGGGSDEELLQRLEKETGGKRPEKKDMPPVKENEYFCRLDKVVKEIPEGYKRTADGYITRI